MTTGHADGLITLDLAESDDARRVARREQLAEPYRTVLGHLRHEIGHFYWPLVAECLADDELARARELFGDERDDYDAALERHYAAGPPPAWEDAPRQRLRDHAPRPRTGPRRSPTTSTSATASRPRAPTGSASSGRRTPRPPGSSTSSARRPRAGDDDFEHLLGDWLPLTYALNALTRSIGRSDLYPFVLSPRVIEKLAFVHGAVQKLTSAARDASIAKLAPVPKTPELLQSLLTVPVAVRLRGPGERRLA